MKPPMKLHVLALLSGLVSASTMFAPPVFADALCRIPGWAPSPGGAEVPIFAEPSFSSLVVGHVPATLYEDQWMGGDLLVTEVVGNFAHVVDIRAWDGARTAPDGWIDASAIEFVAQTERGFALPDPGSEVLETLDWLMPGGFVRLTGCSGEWARVARTGTGKEIWVRHICANQETTCDMGPGD